MFGIDGPELLVIIIVLVVVVGPKDLPKMMRAFGKATARLRMTAQEFHDHFDEAMREVDMRDVADDLTDSQQLDPRPDLKQVFDPLRSAVQDLEGGIYGVAAPEHMRAPQGRTPAALTGGEADAAAPAQTPEPVSALHNRCLSSLAASEAEPAIDRKTEIAVKNSKQEDSSKTGGLEKRGA